jgi:hypothetical protein
MYGIYDGRIISFEDGGGKMVDIHAGDEELYVPRNEIIEIRPEEYMAVETDLKAATEELLNLKARICRLDEDYRKKTELLREMYMDARRKELSIVNQLLRSHHICQKDTD